VTTGRMPPSTRHGAERPALAIAFLGIASVAALLALPRALATPPLTPDAVGYVATAYDWLEGRGWLDPVTYSYYLRDLRPPVPALAVRAPVISLLLAIPLAFGASLGGLAVVHAVWASLVGASGIFVARRSMSRAAAVAFAAAVAWSYVWVVNAQALLTEATACAALLLALGTARDFHRSHQRALGLAVVVWIGWLTRPNLAVLAIAALAAAALEVGPRAALRARPLWSFAAAVLLLQGATSGVVSVVWGVRPYAHYGLMLELIDFRELSAYRKEYVGVVAFVRAHAPEIGAALRNNLDLFYDRLFAGGAYLHLGWLALPALPYALLRRAPGSLERRFAACAAILLLATALVVWGGFDPMRYPLPGAVCLWFGVCALLGDVGEILAGRFEAASGAAARVLRSAAWALPLLVVVPLAASENAAGWLTTAPGQWHSYRLYGTLLPHDRWSAIAQHWCPEIDHDARVASPDPWMFYLWCGTAGIVVPPDLASTAWVERFLDEQEPGYVVVEPLPRYGAFAASDRLAPLASYRGATLYVVRDPAPGSRPWRAPPPLAHLGRR
jgi:hypothetical protein